MNRFFWQAAILTPALLVSSMGVGNSVSAQTISADKEQVNQTLQQINSYDQLDASQSQVTNVNQLRDVSPTDWAYEALRSLVDRYGCISGFPNQTYRGNQALTRYEFAAGLNSCLNQIERLIASQGSVGQEDIDTISRLSQEFEAELATIGGRVDEIESRTAVLEDSQFSTTTVLKGEAIIVGGQAFGGGLDDVDDDEVDSEVTLSSRVRLNFDTSFTGDDRLRTRLQGGNITDWSDVTGTDSSRLGFDTDNGFDVEVTDLHYRFPLSENTRIWVGALGLDIDDIFGVSNPSLASGGSGALARFNRRNPLVFRGTEGAGAGINFGILGDSVGINALYLTNDANEPNEGEGLTDGSFSAGVQAEFNLLDIFDVTATYLRSYQTAGIPDGAGGFDGDEINLSGSTVNGFATEPFGQGVDTAADQFGGGVSLNLAEKVVLAGFGGYSQVEGIVPGENPEGEIWTWGANISFQDFVKEGSRLSFAGGMVPKFISEIGAAETAAGVQEDQDTSYLAEVSLRLPVNDSIHITPGVIAVFNPNHVEENDTVYVGALRTTFKF